MESRTLYRVQKEDLPKMEELLTQCFARDPLYCKLIPDEETRKRLLPELFKCDLSEFFETVPDLLRQSGVKLHHGGVRRVGTLRSVYATT